MCKLKGKFWFCKWCCGHAELKVLHSNAGYYIGSEIIGVPNCRVSTYMNKEEAEEMFQEILDK